MNWYVLYTKPRAELKTATALHKAGIECYCPTRTEVRQWTDRKKKLSVPLFSNFVFVRLAETSRNSVFGVPGVVRYLFWLGKPAIVRDEEIETLQRWLSQKNVSCEVVHYKTGDSITVAEGPFKNKTGIVRTVSSKEVCLVLESMGYIVRLPGQYCKRTNETELSQSA
ncbi:MAG: UpxY family transcription antiterminator [Bacteroidetes bacterium]|nr:UpxY family transcription antiterminator [Bacteroidota bacterium]